MIKFFIIGAKLNQVHNMRFEKGTWCTLSYIAK